MGIIICVQTVLEESKGMSASFLFPPSPSRGQAQPGHGEPGLPRPQSRANSLWFGDSVGVTGRRRPGQTSGPADSRKDRQLACRQGGAVFKGGHSVLAIKRNRAGSFVERGMD